MAKVKKPLKPIKVLRQEDMLDMIDSLQEALNDNRRVYSKDYSLGYQSALGICQTLCVHLAIETFEVDELDLKS